jgi:hypothetical protein
MATLILTAAGTVIGGPIGGMIGAVIGQQIDSQLFKPKGRQGPRLGELGVQTSSYGSAIPKIFGTMRAAGTVIWSTDLKERKSSSGGGKGRPKTTQYSYSASFAVALSGRPIRDVKRIWADGKLLRGSAGDFKSETGFRLYRGGEGQNADALIASAEGAGQTPAFRGIAYATFEDFELEDYGNRIPSLTFEIEADDGPVALGRIARELSGGLLREGATPAVAGYAAGGDSVRAAIEAIGELAPLTVEDDGSKLVVTTARGAATVVGKSESGAEGAGGAGGRTEIVRRSAADAAGEVSISYYDPARDYQTGLQRATRGGAQGRAERLAVPAVLGAGAAKAAAERRLAQGWAARTSARLHLGPRRCGLRPGTYLRLQGEAGLWKVERWTLQAMVVALDLVRVRIGQVPDSSDASGGRPIGHPDLLHGPTSVRLLDVPIGAESGADRPRLLVAAAGAQAGWRRAALSLSLDDGENWREMGGTAAAAVMGVAINALGVGGAALIDERSHVEVELLNEAMWLEGRSDAALADGANLALLGGELIQFGRAEQTGPRRFRLSRLVRGRRGTEWASGAHQSGERFVLIEEATLAAVEVPASALGGQVAVRAIGLADTEPAGDSLLFRGETVRPPSPVHLEAEATGAGIMIRWVRRSRTGWAWTSGGDTPLGEESEAYRLTLAGAGFERVAQTVAPAYLYSPAQQAQDGLAGALTVNVVQQGSFAASRPATLVFPEQN